MEVLQGTARLGPLKGRGQKAHVNLVSPTLSTPSYREPTPYEFESRNRRINPQCGRRRAGQPANGRHPHELFAGERGHNHDPVRSASIANTVNPLTHTIYVANNEGTTVSVIDGATNEVMANIE